MFSFGGSFSFGELVSGVMSNFNTEYQLSRVQSLIETHKNKLGTALTPLNQAIETIKTNINWLKKNKDNISKWLDENANTDSQ